VLAALRVADAQTILPLLQPLKATHRLGAALLGGTRRLRGGARSRGLQAWTPRHGSSSRGTRGHRS
jgi:hypothetical protein